MERVLREDLQSRLDINYGVDEFILPQSYDEAAKMFVLKDLSVARIYEVTPIPSTVATAQRMETIGRSLARAIARQFDHTIVQVSVVPSRDIEGILTRYQEQGTDPNPVIAKFRDAVVEQFRATTATDMFHADVAGGAAYRTKRWRVIVALIVRPDSLVGGSKNALLDFVGHCIDGVSSVFSAKKKESAEKNERTSVLGVTPAEKRYQEMKEALFRRLEDGSSKFLHAVSTLGMNPEVLSPDGLISIYERILRPLSAPRAQPWQRTQPLDGQLLQGDVIIHPSSGTIMVERPAHYKVISIADPPESTDTGMMSMPEEELGWFSLLDIIGDGFITISAVRMPTMDMRTRCEKRKTWASRGTMDARKRMYYNDALRALKALEEDGQAMVSVQGAVCLYGDSPDQIDERAKRVADSMTNIGVPARVEQHYGPSVFFGALPLGFAPTIEDSKRSWLILDRNFVDLLPIYQQGRGTRTPHVLLRNRLGEPFSFSVWDCETAPHGFIVGKTGSGKSFFVQSMMYSALGERDAIWIAIDRGGSYSAATLTLGDKGVLRKITQSAAAAATSNPLAGSEASGASFGLDLLKHLAAQTPQDLLSGSHVGVLGRAMSKAYAAKREKGTYLEWSDIAAKWPGRVWVHRARKRLEIREIADQGHIDRILAKRIREVGRDLQFELYRRAVLRKRTVVDRETGRVIRTTEYRTARTIDEQDVRWLTNRGYIVESWRRPDTNEEVAVVLYQDDSAAKQLALEGYEYEIIHGTMVVEAEREEDVQALVEEKVQFIWTEAMELTVRQELAQVTLKASPGADTELLAEIVDAEFGRLTGSAIFSRLEGLAAMQNEVYIRDVMHELEGLRGTDDKQAALIDDLLQRFQPYFGSGALAKYFDGPTEYDFDGKKMVCFEIKELSSAGTHLTSAVLGTLLQSVLIWSQSDHLPRNGPRSYSKYLVLEEAWYYMRGADDPKSAFHMQLVSNLIINGLKTFRKFRCSLQVVTQDVGDMAKSEFGKSIISNVQHQIVLTQPPAVIDSLDQWLGWSQEEMAMASTVMTKKGQFSEAMVRCPESGGLCEIVRLVSTPQAYWTFTTDAADIEAREQFKLEARKMGVSHEDAMAAAINMGARTYPHGVKHHLDAVRNER